MTLVGLLLGVVGLVMALATPEGGGANIGAGAVLLLGGTFVVFGLLVVVLDVQYSRRHRRTPPSRPTPDAEAGSTRP